MDRMSIDRQGGTRAAAARTLVATAFVMGFAALVWAHMDFDTGTVPILEHARAPAAAPACGNDCLHAPAGDPSVPGASSVFPQGASSSFDVPPVPTF